MLGGLQRAAASAAKKVKHEAKKTPDKVSGAVDTASGVVADGAVAAKAVGKKAVAKVEDAVEERVVRFKKTISHWLKQKLHERTQLLIDRLPGFIKDYLEDPDMPRPVARLKDRMVDGAWPDFREEIMWELAVALDGDKSSMQFAGSKPDCVRAFLRYHIYPCDKSIWGRLRDPVWLLFTLISVLPVTGVYSFVYLILFFVIDKSDEFQIIDFILQFKGTQFLSHGICRTILGFFLYVSCVTAPAHDAEHACEARGPGTFGSFEVVLLGWVLQVLLVWGAWFLLRYSSDKGRRNLKGTIQHEHTGRSTNGGYIGLFLLYDSCCFMLSVVALFVVVLTRGGSPVNRYDEWPVRHALFACQVVYGYLSMPFFLFTIPLLQNILTHTVPTAYNKDGACCRFVGVRKKKAAGTGRVAGLWGAGEDGDEEEGGEAVKASDARELYGKVRQIILGGARAGEADAQSGLGAPQESDADLRQLVGAAPITLGASK